MSSHSTSTGVLNWRTGLPVLASALVTLREPTPQDVPALVSLLALADARRFGLDDPASDDAALRLVADAAAQRAAGLAFTYIITMTPTRSLVGLIQMRRLDPGFEAAECDCTIAPTLRGTGVFVEAAKLVLSFAFNEAGVHRIESRTVVDNGRATGALRKLGAVHEGVLRRSVRRGNAWVDQALWALVKEDWDADTTPGTHSVH
jgi:ribosomal-protein-alanine N-acetyltransferase